MALRRPRLRPASCPRPSSSRPFACPTSRVAGFSVTAAACGGRTIRRYAKRALFRASSRHSVGPEHSLRCAPSRYISRDCAIRRRGSLRALLISGARTNVTGAEPPPPWEFQRRYRANKYSPPPPPGSVLPRTRHPAAEHSRLFRVCRPVARRPPSLSRFARSLGSFPPPPSRRGGPARPRRAASLAARRARAALPRSHDPAPRASRAF